MLSRLDTLNNRTLYAVTNILSRLISDVPGAKGFFWQLPLFHSFEKIFSFCKTAILGPVSQEKKDSVIKIRNLITQVLTDFFIAAEKDESLYIKIFCWRTKVKNRNISGTRDRIAGDNTEDAMNVEEEEKEEEERQKKRKLRMKKRKKEDDDDDINKKDENKEEDFYQNVSNQKDSEKEDNENKEESKEEKENDKGLGDENSTLDDIFKEIGNDDEHSDTEKNEEKEKEKSSGKTNKVRKLVRGREYDEDEYGDDDDLFGPSIDNDDDNDDDYRDEKIRSEPAKKKKKKKHHHHHHE